MTLTACPFTFSTPRTHTTRHVWFDSSASNATLSPRVDLATFAVLEDCRGLGRIVCFVMENCQRGHPLLSTSMWFAEDEYDA
jgi:hypothetical protein